MLTNKELDNLKAVIILLEIMNDCKKEYKEVNAQHGISPDMVEEMIHNLEDIHTKQKDLKAEASKKANAWNKAHPDIHREHNKQYARIKKSKEKEVLNK